MRSLVVVVTFSALLLTRSGSAEVYTWTDDKGVKHVSTVPKGCITAQGTLAEDCPSMSGSFAPNQQAVPPTPPKPQTSPQPPSVKKYHSRPTADEPQGGSGGLFWLLVGTTAVGVYLFRKFRSQVELETIYVQGPGNYEQDVVGESHYQGALKSICGGRAPDGHNKQVRAYLVLENTNNHDPNAVRVDIHGHTVGYLSREDAQIYRRRLKNAGKEQIVIVCDAIVVGGWDRGLFDKGHFGVRLDLPVDQI